MEEKTVWSTAYSIFVPCGFKYVASRKAWNYERALRRQLIAGVILLRASKHKEMKTYKLETSVNLWVRETFRQSYLTFEAQNLHTEVIEFLRSLLRFQVPPSWLDWSSAQYFNRLTSWLPFIAVRNVIFMKQSDWSPTNVPLGTKKTNKFFYLCAEK